MGSDRMAVVDNQLRVHRLEGPQGRRCLGDADGAAAPSRPGGGLRVASPPYG
jgi:hypothetical protein